MKIALATSKDLPNLTRGDQLLQNELLGLAHQPEPAVWSDPKVNWRDFEAIVIRSCWDYYGNLEAFQTWLSHLAEIEAPLHNSLQLVQWNIDKLYLKELQEKSVAIPETEWNVPNSEAVRASMQSRGWSKAVHKPRMSASGFKTRVIAAGDPEPFRASSVPMMLQEFIPAVASAGELSLIFYGGDFSHAVLKKPRSGDFRVQAEYGGSVESVDPSAAIVDQALNILKLLPEYPLFARVDGIDCADKFMLMELELIEPDLFLEYSPGAAGRLAQALMTRLKPVENREKF